MTEPPATKTRYLSILLLIIILAVGFRFFIWQRSNVIYRDSVSFIVHAAANEAKGFLHDKRQEPIYPVLLRLTHDAIWPGEKNASAPNPPTWEVSAILVGTAATVVCIVLLFAIGARIHTPLAGLWAAFFFAFQPYAVHYCVNGMSELPFLVCVLFTAYLVICSGRRRFVFIVSAGCVAVLALLTRKEGIAVFPAVAVYLLLQNRMNISARMKQIALFLAAVLATLALYHLIGGRCIWFGAYVDRLDWQKAMEKIFSATRIPGNLVLASTWITSVYELITLPLIAWFKVSGFLPGILFIAYLARPRLANCRKGTGLLCLLAGCYLLIIVAQILGTHQVVGRYFFVPSVLIFPVAAAVLIGIVKYAVRNKPATAERRTHIAIAVVMFCLLIPTTIKRYPPNYRQEMHAAARWLQANTSPDDTIWSRDPRPAFYARRMVSRLPWTFRVEYLQKAQRIGFDNCYLVFRGPKLRKEHVALRRWYHYINLRDDVSLKQVAKFKGRKDDVTILQLETTK